MGGGVRLCVCVKCRDIFQLKCTNFLNLISKKQTNESGKNHIIRLHDIIEWWKDHQTHTKTVFYWANSALYTVCGQKETVTPDVVSIYSLPNYQRFLCEIGWRWQMFRCIPDCLRTYCEQNFSKTTKCVTRVWYCLTLINSIIFPVWNYRLYKIHLLSIQLSLYDKMLDISEG